MFLIYQLMVGVYGGYADQPSTLALSPVSSWNFGATVGCFSFSNDASLLLPSSAWTGNYRVTGQAGEGP